MKVGVLGTGIVGQTIATKLSEIGHSVLIGTRDVADTSHRPDDNFSKWRSDHPNIDLATFADTANFAEILVNATSGGSSLAVLGMARAENLAGKILIDIANPLDFSNGMPPTLSVCNDSSLAEEIQQAFADVRVVKALNTMTASLMVNPSLLNGDHNVFVCGNDATAKEVVVKILESFGWKPANILDLGDISAARGLEMYLPLWLRLYGAFGTPLININILR